MKDVAIVGYCRTGIAKAGRGALNQGRYRRSNRAKADA